MNCQFVFLDVGNADSILILPSNAPAIIIDIPKPANVRNWLIDQGITQVGCIYFTHGHSDHTPSLSRIVSFISDWHKRGTIKTICLPPETLKNAFQTLKTAQAQGLQEPRYKLLEAALNRLDEWVKNRVIIVKYMQSNADIQQFGDLNIETLHPSYYFNEKHRVFNPTKLNETSLVLRVKYGKFAALMLADIGGDGISELLETCSDDELLANLVKIPHHGAWPHNSAELKTLLQRINPEIAVLSVGSRNPYGHVVPELFRMLLEHKFDPLQRLKVFLCTELTRTCVWLSHERTSMGKAGLPSKQPCAGNIVVHVDEDGHWELWNQADHAQTLRQIPRAACLGRADL